MRRSRHLGIVLASALFGLVGVDAYAPTPARAIVGTATAQAAYVTSYDALAPYGEWIGLEPFGTVWQPWANVVGIGLQAAFVFGDANRVMSR